MCIRYRRLKFMVRHCGVISFHIKTQPINHQGLDSVTVILRHLILLCYWPRVSATSGMKDSVEWKKCDHMSKHPAGSNLASEHNRHVCTSTFITGRHESLVSVVTFAVQLWTTFCFFKETLPKTDTERPIWKSTYVKISSPLSFFSLPVLKSNCRTYENEAVKNKRLLFSYKQPQKSLTSLFHSNKSCNKHMAGLVTPSDDNKIN